MIFFDDTGGELSVFLTGYLGGWDADELRPKLAQYGGEGGLSAKKLSVHVASLGGDVNAGFALRNAIAAFVDKNGASAPVDVFADGVCASAAVLPFCVPGTHNVAKIGAAVFVHRAESYADGNAAEMEEARAGLEIIDTQIAAALAARGALSVDEARAKMSANSWLSAEDAKAAGLFDEIEGETVEAGAPGSIQNLKTWRFNASAFPGAQGAAGAPESAERVNTQKDAENAVCGAQGETATGSAPVVENAAENPAGDTTIGARLDAVEKSVRELVEKLEKRAETHDYLSDFFPAPSPENKDKTPRACNSAYNDAARKIHF